MPRRLAAVLALAALAPSPLAAEDVVRRVGSVTIRVDTTRAFAGGVAVVRLGSRVRLGGAWALLDGRRAPFYPDRGAGRALVPLALGTEGGPATLGVEIAARGGVQRIAAQVALLAKTYPARVVYLPEPLRLLAGGPEVARDARHLLSFLRSEGAALVPGPLGPPVDAAGHGFGEARAYTGFADLESRTDALGGEHHRGIDYALPSGTPVRAPGAGVVLFSGPLALSGQTIVVDHGQGVVSVLQHLSRLDVRSGDLLARGTIVGLSGQTGLAPEATLEWRLYLHGVAVDPLVLAAILG